jgi:hypothetical protein
MNAKEISPKAHARWNRIKIVSRIARYAILIFLAFSVCDLLSMLSSYLVRLVLEAGAAVSLLWAWFDFCRRNHSLHKIPGVIVRGRLDA